MITPANDGAGGNVAVAAAAAAASSDRFDPFGTLDDSDNETFVEPRGQVRALEDSTAAPQAKVRISQGTSLLTAEQLDSIMQKVLHKDDLPAHIKKHLSSCSTDLTQKVEKSLRLAHRKKLLIDQANELGACRIPAGIRPFKSLNIPELDTRIPEDLLNFNVSFDATMTLREAKEKLHWATQALSRVLDARVMERQIDSIRPYLTADAFVGRCLSLSKDRTDAASDLLNELGLGVPIRKPPTISKARIMQLYSSVMDKVAENRAAEARKQVSKEEKTARKVDKLRETAPHDLLDAKIRQSVASALGKSPKVQKGSHPVEKGVDYGTAFSVKVCGREELLHESIREPPGLEQVFRVAKTKKEKEKKKDKGKGKGKEPTGKGKETKGKGKGKGKSQEFGKGKNRSASYSGKNHWQMKGGDKNRWRKSW